MKRFFVAFIATRLLLASAPSLEAAERPERPNLVYILCDDLGYGDVKCLNPDGKIATPNIDKLAAAGMIFTDAHSSSAVCSPTRYGILTGRYNWRSRLKSGVLGGMSPALIEPGRLTVPGLLKRHGYHTGGIGKWHLGMDWTLRPGAQGFSDNIEKGEEGWRADFEKPIRNGPTSAGFDYYFGISASLDMVPYTFIENDHVSSVPTLNRDFPMMLGRPGRTTRNGPATAEFEAEQVLPRLTSQAVDYIGRRASDAHAGRPFFLYLPLNAPHTPIVPTEEWRGKSGLNAYGDFVMQTDWSVGRVLESIEKHGLADSTLVIFASDNGCSPEAKFDELLAKAHNPNFQFRGSKADIYEGGHHIPFIVRWPGKVKAGTTSNQLICLNDLMATCAEIVGVKLPDDAGEDSMSILPVLLGKTGAPVRETLVHHSINGSFSIRQGKWKLALCSGSGGWSAPRLGQAIARTLPAVQLYDLSVDIGERQNVYAEHPDIVRRLTQLLVQYVSEGRSTPGAPQKNQGDVDIWKSGQQAQEPSASTSETKQ